MVTPEVWIFCMGVLPFTGGEIEGEFPWCEPDSDSVGFLAAFAYVLAAVLARGDGEGEVVFEAAGVVILCP